MFMIQGFDSLGREINTYIHKKTCICRSTQNSPKLEIIQCSSIGVGMNKLFYFPTTNLWIHTKMRINFKNIKFSKISQT